MNENKKAAPGRDGKRATPATTLNIAHADDTISSPYNQDLLNHLCVTRYLKR